MTQFNTNMAAQFTMTRRVQFAETDLAGIVHFSNFHKYMEETEHAFFRSLGLKIMQQMPDGTVVGWPRVRSSCNFEAPAYYDDVLEIDLNLLRRGVKSLTMSFLFRRDGTRIANGELKTVCCICKPGGTLESIEMPPEYQAKLVEHNAAPP